jgi:ATP-dependent DNA ligase
MQKGAREKQLKDAARFTQPMKPTMVSRLPDDRSWLLEPKLDGYRAIAVKSSGYSNLYSMDAKIYTQSSQRFMKRLQSCWSKSGARW